jgi:hypothetical protein
METDESQHPKPKLQLVAITHMRRVTRDTELEGWHQTLGQFLDQVCKGIINETTKIPLEETPFFVE